MRDTVCLPADLPPRTLDVLEYIISHKEGGTEKVSGYQIRKDLGISLDYPIKLLTEEGLVLFETVKRAHFYTALITREDFKKIKIRHLPQFRHKERAKYRPANNKRPFPAKNDTNWPKGHVYKDITFIDRDRIIAKAHMPSRNIDATLGGVSDLKGGY